MRYSPSMIPGVMIDFLARASVAIAATRDAGRRPHLHYLSGWHMEENGEILVCLVAEGFTGTLMESLEDNGHFAVTAEVIGPHETYQFKGTYAGSRPVSEADRRIHADCRERFVRAVQTLHRGHFSDDTLRATVRPPAIALRIRIGEIYVQTPGPAAGCRLFPPEA